MSRKTSSFLYEESSIMFRLLEYIYLTFYDYRLTKDKFLCPLEPCAGKKPLAVPYLSKLFPCHFPFSLTLTKVLLPFFSRQKFSPFLPVLTASSSCQICVCICACANSLSDCVHSACMLAFVRVRERASISGCALCLHKYVQELVCVCVKYVYVRLCECMCVDMCTHVYHKICACTYFKCAHLCQCIDVFLRIHIANFLRKFISLNKCPLLR